MLEAVFKQINDDHHDDTGVLCHLHLTYVEHVPCQSVIFVLTNISTFSMPAWPADFLESIMIPIEKKQEHKNVLTSEPSVLYLMHQQERIADAKVSARQQCVHEDP